MVAHQAAKLKRGARVRVLNLAWAGSPYATDKHGGSMVSNKRCAHGICKSDNRYWYKPHMHGVQFYKFPRKDYFREKCVRWIEACKRTGLTIDTLKRGMYICSRHFDGGVGPTDEDPDPIPATESRPFVLRTRRPHKKRVKPKQDKELDPAVPKFLIFDELQLIPSEEEDEQQKKRLLKMAEGEAANTGVKLTLDKDLPRFNGGIKVES